MVDGIWYALAADEVYDDAGNELTACIRYPLPRLGGDVSRLDQDNLLELSRKHSAANELDGQSAIRYSMKADSLRAKLRDLQAELAECEQTARQHVYSRQRGVAGVEELKAAIDLRALEGDPALLGLAAKPSQQTI